MFHLAIFRKTLSLFVTIAYGTISHDTIMIFNQHIKLRKGLAYYTFDLILPLYYEHLQENYFGHTNKPELVTHSFHSLRKLKKLKIPVMNFYCFSHTIKNGRI